MQKLLISTKYSVQTHSDAPGGSLSNILFANFFQNISTYKVILHDPFYNSKNLLKPFCDEVIDDLNIDYNQYQRIINPLFYKGVIVDKSNGKNYNVEGINTKEKKFNIKKKNLQIISDKIFVNDKFDPKIISKSFDIPYIYYYDWLARENFRHNIKLNKLKKIPLKKNYITFAIYIRKDNWKTYLNDLKGEDYDHMIKNLISNLKKEYPNSNIIIYGFDRKFNSGNLLDFLEEKKCFFVEDFSDNPLERSLILAKNTDVIFCNPNGFSTFTQILGILSGKLKKINFINSEKNILDILHSRRILSEGIAEKNFINNSYFFNKPNIIIENKFKNFNFDLKKNILINKTNQVKYFIYYDMDNIKKYYFSYKIDKIIFQKLLNQNKKLYKKHNILVIKKYNMKEISKKIDLSMHQHVLTHYNITNKNYNNEELLNGSLDFNKPQFLQSLIKEKKLNTSNLFYEDLFNFTYRECKKNNNIKLKSKIKNIIFIDNDDEYNNKLFSDKKLYLKKIAKQTLKKFGLFSISDNLYTKIYNDQNKESVAPINWKNIISKYKNEADVNCDVLRYQNDENLIYLKKKKIIIEAFDIRTIRRILNKYDAIICRPNKFSLLVKFLFKNKVILFEENNDSIKILKDNIFLSRNYSYLDIFGNKFNNFRELNYYLFKKHLDF